MGVRPSHASWASIAAAAFTWDGVTSLAESPRRLLTNLGIRTPDGLVVSGSGLDVLCTKPLPALMFRTSPALVRFFVRAILPVSDVASRGLFLVG